MNTVPRPRTASGAATRTPGFDPGAGGLARLRGALRDGRTTSVELVRYYLERIERYDGAINAVTAVNAGALAAAAVCDRERAAGRRTGALHGIPFVVKDSFDVAGMVTAGGSVALAGNVAGRDATVVRRLVAQGAIVLAKTNMSELAASHGWLGYSSYGGLTVNPFDDRRHASGSSSGTAAAVAAGFAPFGLGTDTSGSVRGPASVTGLAGIRPTIGLTSRAGVVPLALSLDTTGPVAPSAADLAIVLGAMAGRDPADPGTAAFRARYAYGRREATGRFPAGARLGVLTEFFGGDPEVDRAVDTAIALLSACGAAEVPAVLGPAFRGLWAEVLEPLERLEFATHFEAYLASCAPGTLDGVRELIAVSEAAGRDGDGRRPVNPARTAAYRTALAARGGFGGAAHRRLTEVVVPGLRRRVEDVLRRERLDALVFPTLSGVAGPHHAAEPFADAGADPYTDPYTAAYVASATGLPEVTVPVGTNADGMPIGMSFLGRAHDERTLLALAHAWQRTARVAPRPALGAGWAASGQPVLPSAAPA